MNLTVIDHPLTRHYLTVLRDRDTDPAQFRAAAKGLTYTLVYEATRGLSETQMDVRTPMETTTGHQVEDVVAVPVLRAGLGLLEGVLEMIPNVKVGFAGVARDEETALPQEYYSKLPDLSEATVLICEPMLATGGSLSWAADKVKSSGATHITALCVVTAPPGVERMYEDHPDVRIITAAHDRELNDDHYIIPGLGDMGDRLFGTQ
jgi:uracil phosphoribosyltransferase